MFDFLSAFQIFACVWVIIGIGYFCSKISMFSLQDADAIRRLVYLVAIPAMLFKHIGTSSFTKATWMTFLHGILVQISIHVLVSIIVLVFSSGKLSRKMIMSLVSASQIEFIYYGYPISQVLFTNDHIVHPVIAAFIQFLIVIPFHTYLVSKYLPQLPNEVSPDAVDSQKDDEVQLSKDIKEEAQELEDHDAPKQSDPTGNPPVEDNSKSQEEEIPEDVPQTNSQEAEDFIPESVSSLVLKSVLNSLNICAVLGFLWSITKWTMPKFLASFVNDLTKSVIAAGLFIIGLLVSKVPFLSGCPIEISLGVIFHGIVNPLLSVFWSKLMKMDLTVSRLLAFSYSAPMSLSAYILIQSSPLKTSTAPNIFLWTSALSLPILMAWTLVMNNTSILN